MFPSFLMFKSQFIALFDIIRRGGPVWPPETSEYHSSPSKRKYLSICHCVSVLVDITQWSLRSGRPHRAAPTDTIQQSDKLKFAALNT